MQAKNVCHDNFMFQNEDTSSIENNSPPTGAPKAEATPAAAPAEMKLRLLNTNNTLIYNSEWILKKVPTRFSPRSRLSQWL